MNSLREKIISLSEILKKAKIAVLCIDETKLDSSFTNHQFKIEGISFLLSGEFETPRKEGKWFLFEKVLLRGK